MAVNRTVGFIGVGMMGWPMAKRLVGAGYDVVVYDSHQEKAARFSEEVGGRASASLEALGGDVATVVTMLPNSRVVDDVLFGKPDSLASALAPDSLVIDMTSGVPEQTQDIGRRLDEAGIRMIDAPVSGGVPRAWRGELAIMVGGPEEATETARPVLETMGSITRTGKLGSGQAMKALNNLVSAGGFLIGIEALLIGKKFGLDPATMVDILNSSSGMNNSTKNKFKQYVLSRSFDSGFTIGLMNKDIGIATELARSLSIPVPLSALCREMWLVAGQVVGGDQDHTALTLMSEQLAAGTLTDDDIQ